MKQDVTEKGISQDNLQELHNPPKKETLSKGMMNKGKCKINCIFTPQHRGVLS